MKLTGAAISPALLVARIGERLRARGLAPQPGAHAVDDVAETPPDPWLDFLEQLWRNVDPADPVPYHPGDSQVKRLALQALRLPFQPVLEEVFGSQRRFNRSATESYAHLAAELKRLREDVTGLKAQLASVETALRQVPRASARPTEPLSSTTAGVEVETSRSEVQAGPVKTRAAKSASVKSASVRAGATKSNPAKARATKAGTTNASPAKARATKSDATKTDATKTDATKTDATKSSTARARATQRRAMTTEATKASPAKARATKATATKVSPANAEATKAAATTSGATKASPAKSRPTKASPAKASPAKSHTTQTTATKRTGAQAGATKAGPTKKPRQPSR